MQRPAVLPGRKFGVGRLRTRERMLFRDRNDRAQLAIEPRDAIEIDIREPR
jgi:hypothetical protein